MTTVERPKGRCARIDWDEVEHFAGFGWQVDRIAERLGMEPGSLRNALAKRRERTAKRAGEAS